MLTKYFQEDFKKIKSVLKDFTVSKDLLNMKQSKKYATPGSDDMNSNVFSYLINFLAYGYKSTMTTTHPYNNTMSTEGLDYQSNGGIKNKDQRSTGGRKNYSKYSTSHDDKAKFESKRSVASVGFYQNRNPISSLNNAGRIDIEKRIHLDNLKKHLSNRFEQELAFSTNLPLAGDLRSQLLNHRTRVSGNSMANPKRRFNHPSSAIHNRRAINGNRGNKLTRTNNDDYHSAHNQRQKFPSTLATKLNSNKSGPISHPRKGKSKPKQDKASYEYFLNIASQSLAKKGRRDITTPYMSQPASIAHQENEDLQDTHSQQMNGDNMQDPDLEIKMQQYKNNIETQEIGSIVNHMHNEHGQTFSEDGNQQPYGQMNKPIGSKRTSKYSTKNEDKYGKYTSLRQEKGLSTKPMVADDERSNRSNLQKNRNKLVMNNGQKIKNIYKMTPSKPIMTSVLRRKQ